MASKRGKGKKQPANAVSVPGTVKQYAAAMGISERTARRHIKEGKVRRARKVGSHWVVPLTTEQYAKATGVSVRTARRRATPVAKSVEKAWAEKNDIRKLRSIPAPILGVRYRNAWRWWAWVKFTDDLKPRESMISPGSYRIESNKTPTRPEFVRLITTAVYQYMGGREKYEGRPFVVVYCGVLPWRENENTRPMNAARA